MRSAGVFLLAAGLAGAAAAAGLVPADDGIQVRVTNEVSTGSLAEPSGVPLRQSTLGLDYRARGWTARVELPWREVAGLRQAATPTLSGRRSADQGLGEARLKLVVPLRDAGPAATGLDLVMRMQTGSGTAVGGVGTGNATQSLRLAMRSPLGNWNLFGHLGWRRGGDLSDTASSRHSWHGELGVYRMLDTRIEAGAYADLRQRVGSDPALPEATLYAALDDGDRRWQLFASRAFTPAVPDVAIGLSYRGRF